MLFDQINLSTRERIDHRIRYSLYGGMALFVVAISLANLIQGYRLYEERAIYETKLATLRQQSRDLDTAVSGSGNVSPKAFQALMNKSLKGNRLIALDLFPWVKVLSAIEKALPDLVILDAFRPDDSFTRIHLTGRTESLEELVGFQKRLEASELFTNVVLVDMGLGDAGDQVDKSANRSRMEFNLNCRLRLDQLFPDETHVALRLALTKAPEAK